MCSAGYHYEPSNVVFCQITLALVYIMTDHLLQYIKP